MLPLEAMREGQEALAPVGQVVERAVLVAAKRPLAASLEGQLEASLLQAWAQRPLDPVPLVLPLVA